MVLTLTLMMLSTRRTVYSVPHGLTHQLLCLYYVTNACKNAGDTQVWNHLLVMKKKKKRVSPVPAQHRVEFVASRPGLIGISLVIPTMLARGLVADIFEREWRVCYQHGD